MAQRVGVFFSLRTSVRCWLLLLLLSLGGGPAWGAVLPARPAPADTLPLRLLNPRPWGKYLAYCLEPTSEPATGSHGAALWQAGRFQRLPRSHTFQMGSTEERLWLRATVVNTLPRRTRFVWVLHAFADSATLYVQPGGRGRPVLAGCISAWQVAHRRALPVRSPALPFWLDAHQTAVLYLRVQTDAGEYYLPSHIDGYDAWLTHEYDLLFSSWWPLLVSFFLSSVLFNLVLYAWMRDPIHLWYGAYVLLASWYLYMEDMLDAGILPQSLYSLGWGLGQFGVLLLALAAGLRVLTLFVRLRQGWPRLYRWGRVAMWAAVAVAAASLGVRLAAAGQPATLPLVVLNRVRDGLLWVLLLGGLATLLTVWVRGRPPQRRLARLYAATYGLYFLGTLNMLLNHTGYFNIHVVEPNLMAWGLALELLTLSFLLTGRFRQSQRQAIEARQRRQREREAAGQRLIAAQDEEREALARELHDALAPGLTALHLAWQGRLVRAALSQSPPVLAEAHMHTEALLRHLRHEVRTLSQALQPTPPGPPQPLPEALALLVDTLSLADDGPEVSCTCDPAAAQLRLPLQAAAYRLVAELLHNALRHAQARHVRVAVQCPPGRLVLLVEDNGRGFDPAQATGAPGRGGLGLRGMQARVSYLRGQVQLRSQPGQGTHVRIELPAG